MDKFIWQYKDIPEESKVEKICSELGVDKILGKLLVQRGIETFEQAKKFFRPSLADLHNPFLMRDMDVASDRIISSISGGENILIYGDYDVDGTTSVALMYNFLSEIYNASNLFFYIPDRYKEGYGVSFNGIDYAIENKCGLIITLDCGIKAIDKVDYAKENSIDVIICDHHTPGDDLPNALAVLDPKRKDCEYPFKELSGCGIGFKLISAISFKMNLNKSLALKQLELVAISTSSDIVPMVGENRVLVHFGIKAMETSPSLGVKSLLQISKLYGTEITVSNIVFKIGPRINAVGRLTKAENAVKILISNDLDFINETVKEIDQLNSIRQDIDKQTTEEALAIINSSLELKSKFTTVVYNREWNKGIVGIVASRLTESYYRPTIVLTESNGLISGSARSVSDFDLYSAILECSDLLENFGGHNFAAGVTLHPDNLEEFIDRFERIVKSTIKDHQRIKKIEIDSELNFPDISSKFLRILKQFGPFGPGNMQPVFASLNTRNNGGSRLVGATQEHLKLGVKHKNINMEGIAFGMASMSDIVFNEEFDLCYTIEENHFNGRTTSQLMVKDIKDSSENVEFRRYFTTVLDKQHLFESGGPVYSKK